MQPARYGWQRDLPDWRDQVKAPAPLVVATAIDLRPFFPPVYDQGNVGSCTGNAVAGAIAYIRRSQGLPEFTPSRLMLYYGARLLGGTPWGDTGAQIRDAIKSAAQWGACPEDVWPYDPAAVTTVPNVPAYAAGKLDRAIGYHRILGVQSVRVNAMRATLADGDPVVFGFTVYDGFESTAVAANGKLNMPGTQEKTCGGHAVTAVGYDDAERRFIVRNSWGEDWGDNGYFTMPYDYVANPMLSADFWTVRLVTP